MDELTFEIPYIVVYDLCQQLNFGNDVSGLFSSLIDGWFELAPDFSDFQVNLIVVVRGTVKEPEFELSITGFIFRWSDYLVKGSINKMIMMIIEQPNRLILRSPYNRDYVDALKQAIPYRYRRFDYHKKEWSVHLHYLNTAYDLGEKFFGSVNLRTEDKDDSPVLFVGESQIQIYQFYHLDRVIQDYFDENYFTWQSLSIEMQERMVLRELKKRFISYRKLSKSDLIAFKANVVDYDFGSNSERMKTDKGTVLNIPSGFHELLHPKTAYFTLQLSSGCEQHKIKQQFWKLAKQHHPDMGGDIDNFIQIKQAYEMISTPKKRRKYDLASRFENTDEISFPIFLRGKGFLANAVFYVQELL